MHGLNRRTPACNGRGEGVLFVFRMPLVPRS